MNTFLPRIVIVGAITAALTPGFAFAEGQQTAEDIDTLRKIYASFNARNIDGVLSRLSEDVTWANGMEGDYVHGRDGVRKYWTKQWKIVSPHVDPLSFTQAADGSIVVQVKQVVLGLDGKPDQTTGLKDRTLSHVFHFENGKVTRFDIRH